MANYQISLTKTAEKQLDKLDDKIAKPVIETIQALSINPRPVGYKKLKGRPGYRIRTGDYRIIYEVYDKQLLVTIIALGHRKGHLRIE